MAIVEALLLSALTGGASAMATVIALKVDIKWMRDILKDHKNRGEWIQISAYRGRQFIVDDPNPVPASGEKLDMVGYIVGWTMQARYQMKS
ncbi:hypothetical protein ACGRH2_12340 [Vibrio barjaei]|jgi:hypothetical protein|uniref:Peptidase S24/S26A/S26B/S26C domain-containing protein n=1 Tax=Vibrio barjaei TaxID=1676683 RepID=A0ABW7IHU8_9VIBR